MRAKSVSYLVSMLFVLCIGKLCVATPLLLDSTKYELRSFDTKKIEKEKKEKRYDYGKEPNVKAPSENVLIKYLGRLIDNLIHILFDGWKVLSPLNMVIRMLIYLAFFGFILFVAYQVFNLKNVFSRKKSNINISYDIEHENIHEIDLQQLLAEALKNEQYRVAVRIQYLLTLKKLSDHGQIQWSIEKTNMHYIFELKERYKTNFIALTQIFDWVWYGEHAIDDADYAHIEKQFVHFSKMIA